VLPHVGLPVTWSRPYADSYVSRRPWVTWSTHSAISRIPAWQLSACVEFGVMWVFLIYDN